MILFQSILTIFIKTSKEYGLYNSTVLCIDYVPKDQIPKLLSMATIADPV